MALTHLAFCDIGFVKDGTGIPVPDGDSAVSQALTPSGTNQQSSAATKPFVRVATDTTIYVAIAANPDATVTGSRFLVLANTVEYFQIDIGNKVGVAT